ncbi:hypothetical protein JP0552_12340 [Helicobacter pylori]
MKNYAQKLENSAIITLNVKISGRSTVWLAHLVWDQGVGGIFEKLRSKIRKFSYNNA